jgi:hypothetical protein
MNTNARWIAKIALFLLGVFVIDRAIGLGLGKMLHKVDTGEGVGRINAAIENVDNDIFVFGSSRGRHHIDPRILEKDLGAKAFNVSSNGMGIDYALMLESMLLKRGTHAKVFVAVVLPTDLYKGMTPKASMFAPFVNDNPVLHQTLDQDWRDRFKLSFYSYRYNSLIFPILKNYVKKSPDFRGYLPLSGHLPEKLDTNAPPPPEPRNRTIDPKGLENYAQFVDLAKARGIKVVFVVGPTYRYYPAQKSELQALQMLRDLAQQHGATFLYMDENELQVFKDPKLYKDAAHLNEQGAVIFSNLLADRLAHIFPGMFSPAHG